MKKVLFLFLLAAFAAGCSKFPNSDTGNRPVVPSREEARPLTGFKGVRVSGAVTLVILFGSKYDVNVRAEEKIVGQVVTRVDGDTLVIETTDHIDSKSPVQVKITMPELKNLDLLGAINAEVAGLKGDKFVADLSGASKLKIYGDVREFKVRATGASEIEADPLKAENVDANASGASRIVVSASGELVAEATGASKIVYAGDPKTIKQNASGVSSVTKKE